MAKIVLISCVNKKLQQASKAKDLYISPLFRYNYRYAESLNPDKIFILSAKYGLVDPEDIIEPYNETLNNKSKKEIKEWAIKVLNDFKGKADVEKDKFVFLAGNNYRMFLTKEIKKYEVPLKGLAIGKQLSFLKNSLLDK
jgi:hypothetical protein